MLGGIQSFLILCIVKKTKFVFGLLPQRRVAGESPRSPSMRSPCLVVEVVGGLPHGMFHSP
jgi:hypothetical protein